MLKRLAFFSAILIVISALCGAQVMGQTVEEGTKLYEEGVALYNTASSQEELIRAVEKWEQALRIFESMKFHRGISDAANSLGVIHAKLGQYSKAV